MWRRQVRRQQHPAEPAGSPVGPPVLDPEVENEFDAFLAGRYAEWALARRQAVPAWAWVNQVAHGSRDDLETLARSDDIAASPADRVVWHAATVFLAKEVLGVAGDDTDLRRVQQEALVPVELQLADQWWRPVAPTHVVRLVLTELQKAARHG